MRRTLPVKPAPAPALDMSVVESRLSAESAPLGIVARTSDTSAAALETDVVKLGLVPITSAPDPGAAHDGGGVNTEALFNGTTRNGAGGDETLNDGKTFRGYGRTNSLTLHLDTSKNRVGYDLTKLLTFAGHPDSRGSQSYAIYLAFAAEPTKFIRLASASVPCSGGASELRFTAKDGGVLDNGTGCRAHGVVAVRFEFQDGPLGFNVYREINLVGQPTKQE